MKFLFNILVLLFLCSCQNKTDIKGTWNNFIKSIESEKLSSASFLDSESINWISDIKDKALRLSKDDFNQLSIDQKVFLLVLRHQIPKQELENMDPYSLFDTGVQDSWIEFKNYINYSVQMDEDQEKLQKKEDQMNLIISSPAPEDVIFKILPMRFTKEDGKWRVNFIDLMRPGNMFMSQLIKDNNLNENNVIFEILNSKIENFNKDLVDPVLYN